ncbi:hypothetical protein CLIB1423_12S03202 [[Candida] railenensis]|uniref:SnoaL-like domain-containing protein n=1 Tax=[Candida] railenensis TaxID=45579 RepID=A0A9P0VZP2_9ASCO|nr:hypothetical protein CLIB1423_12S03202 [[Candida] railenensis]
MTQLVDNENLNRFLNGFYRESDVKPPVENDPYLSYLTNEAKLVMGSTVFDGKAEIAQMRQNMWTKVTKRHHVVEKVAFVNPKEVLLTGYVEYTLFNGKTLTSAFAGNAVFENDDFKKMSLYHVYLDTAPMAAALSS